MKSPLVFALALLSFLLAGSDPSHAAPCTTHLGSVGAVDPANGYPSYYVDANGTALQPCLDLVCDPALALPDPTKPTSFPDNFPAEWFYNRAIATITGPGAIKAVYTAAVEGSFVNGTVVDGDQLVFSRIRIRVQGLTPNKSYTVTHPYGVNTFTSDSAGSINFTQDVNLFLAGVNLALTNSNVGPFLTFASGPIPPAPGLLGNPVTDQFVTGSDCNTNLFRVAGTGLPGGKIETSLFNPVIARKVSVCGNGVVDFKEDCDDGNTLDGDCCSSTCKFEASGSTCDDGNPCTDNAAGCDGAGVCTGTPIASGTPCDDGNACTINETCDGAGSCVGVVGPPPTCPTATITADVYVDSANAKKKFGTATTLKADAKPIQQTFFQTHVTGLGAHAAGSAKLRLFVTTASKKSGGQIHAIPCGGFSEATTIYNNKPAITTPVLSSLGKVAVKKTVEFEVGSALNAGDGDYCFALDTTESAGVAYASREAKTGKPALAVLNVDGCACVP